MTQPEGHSEVNLEVDGQARTLHIDNRVTLLDALREHLGVTAPKKGCDHGQCGSCTVLRDGRRVTTCLTFAVAADGARITTAAGLGPAEDLHPVAQAFHDEDAFQCGYCTPGQICSAVGMLDEVKSGAPSFVSEDLDAAPELTDDEIRERMSGNLCRCAAFRTSSPRSSGPRFNEEGAVKTFDYHLAQSPADAVATLAAHPGAAYLAGGTNLVDHMKLGVAAPDLLVDVSRLALDEITPLADGGVRIGATVRNSDLAADPLIRSRYPVLARALLSAASGQLRHAATTAGNLLQRTRCVYFQDVTTPCNKREPGTGCSAIGGYVRYHAILGTSPECIAAHPSDMAVAMCALDAEVLVEGAGGSRRIPLDEFYRLPGDEPHRDTTLGHGELITAVELPAPPAGAVSDYRKVRDRASYAFALVSVAAELSLDVGEIRSARIALGGIAHKPWRARKAEQVLVGAEATEDTFTAAAAAELADARTQPGNEFKVPLTRRALVAELRTLTERSRR